MPRRVVSQLITESKRTELAMCALSRVICSGALGQANSYSILSNLNWEVTTISDRNLDVPALTVGMIEGRPP